MRIIFCLKIHKLLKNTHEVFLHWHRKTCPFHKANDRPPARVHWLHCPEHPYYFNLLFPKLLPEGLYKRLLPISYLLNGKTVYQQCKAFPSFSVLHITHHCPTKKPGNSKSEIYLYQNQVDTSTSNGCNIFVLNQTATYPKLYMFFFQLAYKYLGLDL